MAVSNVHELQNSARWVRARVLGGTAAPGYALNRSRDECGGLKRAPWPTHARPSCRRHRVPPFACNHRDFPLPALLPSSN